MRIDRQAIYDKCNGHCAYCGTPITLKQLGVDHVWPQHFSEYLPIGSDINSTNNLLPACKSCNTVKGVYFLDEWRAEISKKATRLRRISRFALLLRFGIVEIVEKPVIFYFETMGLAMPLYLQTIPPQLKKRRET